MDHSDIALARSPIGVLALDQARAQHHRTRYLMRRSFSALCWLLMPVLTLILANTSERTLLFRPHPTGASFDTMFLAGAAAVALTSLWLLYSEHTRVDAFGDGVDQRAMPASWAWYSALDLCELALCAGLAAASQASGACMSALVWTLALLVLGTGTLLLAKAQRTVPRAPPAERTPLSVVASLLLYCGALLILVLPELRETGLDQWPTLRGYLMVDGSELTVRMLLLCLAIGMLVAATDPLARHRSFLFLLVLIGFLQAYESALHSLLSAAADQVALVSDDVFAHISGWLGVALATLLALATDRWRVAPPFALTITAPLETRTVDDGMGVPAA